MTVEIQETSLQSIRSFLHGLSSEVVPVNTGDSEQITFRAALRKYFDSLPYHGVSSSSDHTKIERVIQFPTFRCSVTTFGEARHIERCIVPYKGWKIPQLKKNEANTKPWEFNWVPGATPSSEAEKKIIGDSQEVQPCSECKAIGKVNCSNCNCTGKVDCRNCQSRGIVDCPSCKGHGKHHRQKQVQKFRPCDSCGTNALVNVLRVFDANPYTNVRRCVKCNGTGQERYFEIESYDEDCPACKTKGKVLCNTCKGHRSIQCNTCSGQGHLQCEHCKGQKSIVSYLELRRTFESDLREQQVVGEQAAKFLQRSFLEPFAVGQITKQSWADADPAFLETALKSFSGTSKGIGATVCDEVRKLLAESVATAHDPIRKTAWKIDIQIYKALLVTYLIGERKFQAIWESTPLDTTESTTHVATVWPHTSIVSNWCRNELKSIQAIANSAGVRDAAIEYQRLDAIAKIDPACKAAIAAGQKDLGLHNVARASERIWASQAQIVMYITSGVLLLAAGVLYAMAQDKIPAIACLVCSTLACFVSWMFLKR